MGFVPTVSDIDPEKYPSQFHSDNTVFNEIWKLGAKAAGLACLEKGTQGPIMTTDPAKGALVQSMRASPNFETGSFENYTLQFETKIERSGLWWTVVSIFSLYLGILVLTIAGTGPTFDIWIWAPAFAHRRAAQGKYICECQHNFDPGE
jgi:hypothetical protein